MPHSNEAKENLWSGLLDSVSSGRRLPDKQLLVAGGEPELQKDFLETLNSDSPKRLQDSRRKLPPVSNEFALGYTYQEVLDADHEDILARLSVYTLHEPIPAFAPLVKTLLNPQTASSFLVVILLDWNEPWKWMHQIRDWILFLQTVIASLDHESLDVLQQNIQNPGLPGAAASPDAVEGAAAVPRGPGESDEALGLPITVVCHNSNRIENLEKEYSWREEEFDYLLQFLRTILLKYGASLIYTSNSSPNSLPLLVQSCLDVHSSLRRQTLKHNVVDRESILIPPDWDSWGKIRVIREGFDVEGISEAWSTAVQAADTSRNARRQTASESVAEGEGSNLEPLANEADWAKILQAFSEAIKDPSPTDASTLKHQGATQVKATDMQEFLAQQAAQMEQLRLEDEKAQAAGGRDSSGRNTIGRTNGMDDNGEATSEVHEHIGPVKVNMGGIQVDAEDMLKTLRTNDREETPGRDVEPVASPTTATPDGKPQNEALASFFAGLIKKGGANSPKPSPKP